MSNPSTLRFFRRKRPHWLVADRAYFVTIRLKNTLPKHVLEELKEQQQGSRESDLSKRREQFVRIEQFLDASDVDARLLDNPEVADMLMENLSWFETRGWMIYAAVVLSTHMHMLMRNENGDSSKLIEHLGMYKNYTARLANKLLGRNGAFWATEDFDHWIRTPDKFESTVRYIAHNPVKAGRVKGWIDWKWVLVHQDFKYCLDE